MAKYVENFMEWVEQMNKEYRHAPEHIQAYSFDPEKYVVIVSHRTGKVAKAKCHKDDEFDAGIGIAIAWARYRGYEIPIQRTIKKVHSFDLEYGQHFLFAPDREDEYIFIGQHPVETQEEFIYSSLDGRIKTEQNMFVYLIS